MASIVEKTIGDTNSGPYIYHVKTVDYESTWTYIGKSSNVALEPGPTDATAREAKELADGYNSSDVTDVEFHSLEGANDVRDMIPDAHLADSDSRNQKTIQLNPTATKATRQLVTGEAADSKSHLADEYGQAPLTDDEKDAIDVNQKDGMNIMTARSVKAIFYGNGVNDWLQHADTDLSVDENREIAVQAAQNQDGSKNLDAHEDTDEDIQQKYADAYTRSKGAREDRAEQACRDGHGEACGELRDLGWSEEKVEALQSSTGSAEKFARAVQDERQRNSGVSPAAAD